MNAATQPITDEEAAFISNLRKLCFQVGWLRARFDYEKNGYFEPLHYPEGTPEHAGYSAFVKSIRDARKIA